MTSGSLVPSRPRRRLRSLALLLTLLLESEEPSESSLMSRVAKLSEMELRTLLAMEEQKLTAVVMVPVTTNTLKLNNQTEKKHSMDDLNTVKKYPWPPSRTRIRHRRPWP